MGLGCYQGLVFPQLLSCGPQESPSATILAFSVKSSFVTGCQALPSEARSLEPTGARGTGKLGKHCSQNSKGDASP